MKLLKIHHAENPLGVKKYKLVRFYFLAENNSPNFLKMNANINGYQNTRMNRNSWKITIFRGHNNYKPQSGSYDFCYYKKFQNSNFHTGESFIPEITDIEKIMHKQLKIRRDATLLNSNTILHVSLKVFTTRESRCCLAGKPKPFAIVFVFIIKRTLALL